MHTVAVPETAELQMFITDPDTDLSSELVIDDSPGADPRNCHDRPCKEIK